MTDNRTTELREKLDDLIIELDRLDIALDRPASSMTIGEYEQEREKLLDGFTQAIAATLGDDAKPCPWCGREMQEGHCDGHVWYRDDSDYITSLKRSIDALQEAHATLDGGEIVRCRDCRYYDESLCNWHECSCCGEPMRVEPDGFCAWGEKRR